MEAPFQNLCSIWALMQLISWVTVVQGKGRRLGRGSRNRPIPM